MRYLAWVAIFSLQMGMFVCGAGIDVCHAADAPAHIEATQSNNNSDAAPVDSTCAAHAAHVFLSPPTYNQSQSDNYATLVNAALPMNLFEVHYLIEHPPKLLHS
ncbi:MAG: hypothetical protein COB41_09270 [Proteobacteria bacterium]|nr:MAG: hypothetical protein COB41_09270 [Pseudomonadota bacterium]